MNNIISNSDVFLSLFYKCASSKVTCQAISCELPILFVESGGIPEIVNGNGVIVNDDNEIKFIDKIPDIDIYHLINKYKMIKKNYKYFSKIYTKKIPYQKTIGDYFNVFNNFI